MRLLKKPAAFLIVVAMAASGGASIVSASTTIDQLGSDIDGEVGSASGFGMSFSSDGSIVAIGGYLNDGINGGDSGHVRVYEWNGAAWQQKGNEIDGEAASDYSGLSVSLSSDGAIVAIGAYLNDGINGGESGHVRLYEWDGNAWQQKGNDIDGEAAGDYSGSWVSLSSDGSIVAIGAYGNDDNGTDSGHVRLYEWDGAAWAQRGDDIDGEAEGDQSGLSVSLSSDGSIVAIGAFDNEGVNGVGSGHVRLYEWDGSAWQQKGDDIDGEAANDVSGSSVSLSADGSIVAIGAYGNDGMNGDDSGHVRLFEWDGSAWQQKGSDIDGEAAGDFSGRAVSLSSDGSIVAIGGYLNDGINGVDSGHVRLYEWDGSAWQQKGSDIDGEAENDQSGLSVSLSSDGSIVAIGASGNDGNGESSGHVRVYSIATTQNITTPEPDENVELPATGPPNRIIPQALLVLGVGGLLMLFSRRRLNVRN